jgi:pimeloyl-ACP methyl ester carboxylesterase
MAHDLSRLLRDHLRITHPVILVGHDIGLMIAYAYAQAYRDAVSHLAIIDAPLPGTSVFERVRASPRVWHFAFHNAHDIAEVLVAGRERLYLQAFFDARVFNPSAIEDGDLDRYTAAYSAPGAMRAAFELYRAFERDGADNQDALRRNGKLVIPVLAAWGAISNSGPVLRDMMEEVANDVTGVEIANAGHWIPEENPGALVAALLNLLSRA